jgi:hypothetical protein
LASRTARPPGRPATLLGQQRLRLVRGEDVHQLPAFPRRRDAPAGEARGDARELPLGPALLFLVLEKLRRTGRSERSELANVVLAGLFAFGTVYFFTAVEGTVWFAAHVVGVALVAGYLLCALDAANPLIAGLLLGCSFATRPVTSLLAVFFALEAFRVSAGGDIAAGATWQERITSTWQKVDRRDLFRRYATFAAPILPILALCAWSNHSRFHSWSPTDFGHEYLSVAWHDRMHKWGLFGYHYLAKNLGCALTIVPWLPAKGAHVVWWPSHGGGGAAPFQINEHGLALWFTTPLYLWLLRPRERGWLHGVVLLSIAGPIVMLLLYQNTGWRQFGYRFSNDYAPLLFILIAIDRRPFGWLFRTLATWGVIVNLFGAITFDRSDPRCDRFYFRDGSQVTVYQPD